MSATATKPDSNTKKPAANKHSPQEILAGHATKIQNYTRSAVDAADSIFYVRSNASELLGSVKFSAWVESIGFDLPRAYQLSALGEARHILRKEKIKRLPIMESSVRELVTKKKETAKFVEAWQKSLTVAGPSHPTAAQVAEVIKEVWLAEPLTPEAKAKAEAAAAVNKAVVAFAELLKGKTSEDVATYLAARDGYFATVKELQAGFAEFERLNKGYLEMSQQAAGMVREGKPLDVIMPILDELVTFKAGLDKHGEGLAAIRDRLNDYGATLFPVVS